MVIKKPISDADRRELERLFPDALRFIRTVTDSTAVTSELMLVAGWLVGRGYIDVDTLVSDFPQDVEALGLIGALPFRRFMRTQ
jgi:hypothetical protein